MTGRVQSRLESHGECEVVRQLHDVPPHEVYEVRLDGTRAICKISAGPEADPATEARVIEHVREHATVPVPRVLATGEDYFVASWLDGVPDDPGTDEARARTMGRGLATLHEQAPVDAHGFFRAAGGLLDAHERWSNVLLAMLADRRDYLDGEDAAVAAEAIDFVRGHRGLFDPAEPVVVHGNFLPDHVGVEESGDVRGGNISAVIDFEHALAGAAGWDLVRAVLPLHSSEGEPMKDAFLAGYEAVRGLPEAFDRRYDAHVALTSVSYLKALHLQNQHSRAETERKAERMREHVSDALDELAER